MSDAFNMQFRTKLALSPGAQPLRDLLSPTLSSKGGEGEVRLSGRVPFDGGDQ